jgi:hypothetical protein
MRAAKTGTSAARVAASNWLAWHAKARPALDPARGDDLLALVR